jgi:hypothetical protein
MITDFPSKYLDLIKNHSSLMNSYCSQLQQAYREIND